MALNRPERRLFCFSSHQPRTEPGTEGRTDPSQDRLPGRCPPPGPAPGGRPRGPGQWALPLGPPGGNPWSLARVPDTLSAAPGREAQAAPWGLLLWAPTLGT